MWVHCVYVGHFGGDPNRGYMADLIMLVGASVVSMAGGVLAAYGIFKAGFALMRPRQRSVPVKSQAEIALQ